MIIRGHRISRTSAMHYLKFFFRIVLFFAALVMYIISKVKHSEVLFSLVETEHPLVLWLICGVFVVEMALRFFPSSLESKGCQKQFSRNYIPVKGNPAPVNTSSKTIFFIALGWCAFNGIFGVLHIAGILDYGIMFLLCLAYSICDIICILFFCPFQTWFMKNKCCGSCRIYNWDYAMMFTPLLFVKQIYTWLLLGLALGLMFFWELVYFLHPERFSETTNQFLRCSNCTEKLCSHKKQLLQFWKQNPQLQMLTKRFRK